jgi:hypothetical protein
MRRRGIHSDLSRRSWGGRALTQSGRSVNSQPHTHPSRHTHAHSTPDPRPTAFLATFRLPRHGEKVQTRPESSRRPELSVPARPGPFVQTDWTDLGRGGSCGGLRRHLPARVRRPISVVAWGGGVPRDGQGSCDVCRCLRSVAAKGRCLR